MRIVLDTNVLIAALITEGTPPDQLYRAWRDGRTISSPVTDAVS
jgi:predicted nucleic acid-binding protein